MNWGRIAGFILLGYIVFTTMKGNLRRWLQVFGLKPDDNSTGFSGIMPSGSSTSILGNLGKGLGNFGKGKN